MLHPLRYIAPLALLAISLIGCGGGDANDASAESVKSSIKSILTETAKSGSKESAFAMLSFEIERLRQFDPAQADQLQAEYAAIEQASKPADVKKLAEAALGKL